MSAWKLYEIDAVLRDAIQAAEAAVDVETGERPEDWAGFLETCQLERDKKCLGVAAYVRECRAEADAVKTEAKRLIARASAAERRAERVEAYLARTVQPGEPLSNTWVAIGWRKSNAVVIDDEAKLPESCFKIIRQPSKTEIKAGIEAGTITDGAHIETRQNIQIR